MTTQNTIDKADKLYQMGQCNTAVDLLLDAVRHYPEDTLAYYRLAEHLIDSRQFESALEILNGLPQKEPDFKKKELVGYCYVNLGNLNEADRFADQILSIDPDSASAMNLKGLTAYQKGKKNPPNSFSRSPSALIPISVNHTPTSAP